MFQNPPIHINNNSKPSHTPTTRPNPISQDSTQIPTNFQFQHNPFSYLHSLPKKSQFFSSFILSVSAESNLPKESLHLYMLIRKDNFFPSLASFNLLLECLVSCGQYVRVLELFDHAVGANIRVDQFTFGKAVQSAVKIGDVRRRVMDARKLFDEMLETRVDCVVADKVTFNAMIDGYCKVGDVDEAFRIRDKMKGSNVEANLVTFNTLINGLCRAKRMDEAKKVWEDMKAHGFVPDGFSYSSLFDGFSRSGDLNGLVSLYEQADNDGIRVNAYTYGVLLNGLCKGGRTNKAEEILEGNIEMALLALERMKSYGLKPSCVTVNSVINQYCQSGNLVEAEKWIKTMPEMGVSPDVVTYNILIDGFGRNFQFDKCFELLEEMESNG
ncbi:putative tetratricopeptide-like helical domain superfamily, pentacotripeptide-repeat region of PRORP [Helianthus annuus]|nr:putative tetratricopeptide-like helical domain superfamily, pentacotripeptide-repeat region of PRORP [Helianthus annuus]